MNKEKKLWQIVTLLAIDLVLLIFISLISAQSADALHMGHSGEKVTVIQQKLTEKGFFCGKINGRYGTDTRAALRSFQEYSTLDPSGEADYATIRALGINSRTHPCFSAETELLARCIQESGCNGYAAMLKKAEEILSKAKAAHTMGSFVCECFPDIINSDEPSPDAYAAALQAIRQR